MTGIVKFGLFTERGLKRLIAFVEADLNTTSELGPKRGSREAGLRRPGAPETARTRAVDTTAE